MVRHGTATLDVPADLRDVSRELELSIIIPCLNEAETIGTCVAKATSFLRNRRIDGEIIVADNGSTDLSRQIAQSLGARVVDVPIRGYGAALQAGIAASRGLYVLMADADDSYDFSDPIQFVDELRAGRQLVIGNRFRGSIEPGAMPLLNRYLGNPVLSFIGRLFFKIPIKDFHCGIRAFSRQAILDLDLHTTGMEYASEMIVRAAFAGLRMSEVPTTLSVDGRSRPPHLRPWRDGWRHLRFLLLFSPRWLFLYPGLILIALALVLILVLLPGPSTLGPQLSIDVRAMLVASGMMVVGLQSVSFAFIARKYATVRKLMPPSPKYWPFLEHVTLERLAGLGALVFAAGVGGIAYALVLWSGVDFGRLEGLQYLRLVIISVTALIAGGQLVLTGFLSGMIEIGYRS